MVRVNIPRLISRRIRGKTYWTWQPTRAVKALGYKQESFGTDRDRAIIRTSPGRRLSAPLARISGPALPAYLPEPGCACGTR